MDDAITPPLRIQTVRTGAISSRTAHARLDHFMHAFHARTIASGAGASTISVQLQKLTAALHDECSLEQHAK